MPSKKLPNRVEGLFNRTRSLAKDGRAESAPAAPPPVAQPVAASPAPNVPHAMSGWTWETDAGGAHVFCSAEVETILGFSPQEMQGRTLASLLSLGGSNGEHPLTEAMQLALPFANVRLQVRRKDDQTITLTTTGQPISDEAGHVTGYHGVTYVSASALAVEAQPSAPPPATPANAPAPLAAAGAPAPAAEPQTRPAAPEPPAPEPRASAAPPPPMSAPSTTRSWGYMDGPDGLAPIAEELFRQEISEAVNQQQLIHKANEPVAAKEGEEPHSGRVLAAPIKLQNQIMGALDFFDPNTAQEWTEDDLALAQTVADQLALALENARLFNETRVQQRNATYLARASQAFVRTLSEKELWEALADELTAAYQPRQIIFSRWDAVAGALTPLVLRGELNGGGQQVGAAAPLAGQPADLAGVIQRGQGLIRRHPEVSARTTMLQPLIYNGNVEALVEVATDRREGFIPEDLKLLESILFASGIALRTVRLYELQLQTAERLTEMDRVKSQFLANMSHELRTPLNSIIGFSRVILKGIDGPLTEPQTQDLTSIYNSGRHLLELINDILDMSKIEAGKMEMVFDEVDLHDIVKGVMSTAIGLVKDKPAVMLKEDTADPLPTVHADATRIRQVMINLMSNASKFTDTGSITLRSAPVEERDPLTHQLAQYVQISIIDTGPGIAQEDMHKLFEAFSQVDSSATRKVGGTGLGLSICRRMVELHHGRIWVESEVGKGSIFAFVIPVYQKEQPAEAAAGPGSAPTILVVEDDQGLMGLYRRYLEPHGYKIVCVDKSTETLPSAAENKPVAILLDVVMPVKDGWQVLAELKQNEATRAIPVIMCTIVSDPNRALNLGAAAYLNKPILEADLLHTLEKILSQPQPVALPTS